MTNDQYKKLIKKFIPKEKCFCNCFKAFCIGGFLGIICEILMEVYSYVLAIGKSDSSTYAIITLIFVSGLFTALGFFDKWVKFAKCGLIIPITGFAHSMVSAAIEYRREGFVSGLGANIFKLSGTVILYGVVSAYVFAIIRLLLFGG